MLEIVLNGKHISFNDGREIEIVKKVILEPGLGVLLDVFQIFPDSSEAEVAMGFTMSREEAVAIAEKFKQIDINADTLPEGFEEPIVSCKEAFIPMV